MGKNRYITIAWYSELNTHKVMYVIFDTYTYEVKTLSSEALSVINESVLNINYDDYIDHLTPIWKFTVRKADFLRNDEIYIDYEIKKDRGMKYTVVTLNNVLDKQRDSSVIIKDLIVTEVQDDYRIYNGFVLIGCPDEENHKFTIEIRKKVGFRQDKIENSFLFKRGFIHTNTNKDVNDQINVRNNKLRVMGKAVINYDYIEIKTETCGKQESETWLIKTDLDFDKNIYIPRYIDYIGYNLTAQILKRANNNRKDTTFYVTKSQFYSMIHNCKIAPEIEYFGVKAINKSQLDHELVTSVGKKRLIVLDT